MKILTHLSLYLGSAILISLFQGCSGHSLQELLDGESSTDTKTVAPSQNKALNSISPSTTAGDDHEEYRYMQQNTNAWIKDEWEPLTESNTTTNEEKKVEELSSANEHDLSSDDDNSSYTLQRYVDKAGLYLENKEKRDANKTKAPSHVDKINAMPGIGKRDD